MSNYFWKNMMIKDFLDNIGSKMRDKIANTGTKSTIHGLDFTLALIKSFPLLSKNYTMNDLHDEVTKTAGKKIHFNSFRDRMNTNLLTKRLKMILDHLTKEQYKLDVKDDDRILQKVGVTRIIALDSSISSLWDALSLKYPGVFTTAGLKLNRSINLLTGSITWSEISAASSHDVNHFLPYKKLYQSLVIFDLGYWDYSLFKKISLAGGYFLSRIKGSAKFEIDEIKSGMLKRKAGCDLLTASPPRKYANIIELYAFVGEEKIRYRCLGFWNKRAKKYHWYITNLECSKSFISELYRLRWQIELSFKACKSHFNMDKFPSTKQNTVVNLLLLAEICYQLSCLIRRYAQNESSTKENSSAFTILRASKIVRHVIDNICSFLKQGREEEWLKLKTMISLFLPKLYDPNANKRFTTLQKLGRLTS